MERIQELLAKGIENLTDDELTELRGLLTDEASSIIDESGSAPTDDQAAALEHLADSLDAVKAEGKARKVAAKERADKVASLADRINASDDEDDDDGGEPVVTDAPKDEDETEDETEPAGEPVGAAAAAAAAAEPTPDEVPVPVAASGAVVTRVAARRPASATPAPRPAQLAPIVAAAGVPGYTHGRKMDAEAIGLAFQRSAASRAGTDVAFKLPVVTASIEYPEARQLDMDPHGNAKKIDAVTSLPAITASGGRCSPVPYRYDLPYVGTDVRPVRDALARFGAQRGGIQTLKPPTIADVSGAVGKWTLANDENPSSPTTKPYLTIACDNTTYATDVYAITESFKVGNFRQRWDPERVQAILDLTATWTARYAESLILQTIAAGSKAITHGQVLGSSTDTFTALRQLFAGIRFRHRMPRTAMLRCILPDWLRDNILTDLVRYNGDGGTHEERLARAEASLDAFFRVMGVNVTWHLDYENGKSVGQDGGPFGGTQGVGSMIGYPTKARAYVFLEGSWLFLDGGSLDFGIIRDATLIGTNDMLMFSEFMENVHYHGVPGESYTVDLDICANGGYASPLDITPCVSGS